MSDVPEGHDRGAKLLLGHPRVVEDLLRAFVPQEWLRDVNLKLLHQLPTERTSADLARRIGDIVWAAPCDRGPQDMVFMIEAQSTVDRAMAPRMSALVAMYCEESIRRRSEQPLPWILPIVYYTGRRPWNAPTAISELMSNTEPILPFMRDPCYLLLEASVLVARGVLSESNTASLMMRMEATRDAERLIELLVASADWLGSTDRTLWSNFLSWAASVLVPQRFPSLQLDQFRNYLEGVDMLAESMREWREQQTAQWRRDGLREGRKQGRQEGRLEGERQGQRSLLESIAVRRFGHQSAQRLSAFLDETSNADRLTQASHWIVDCRSEAEFLWHLDSAE